MLRKQMKNLKQKAVSLLCRYDPEYLNQSSEHISSYGYAIRKIIIINLLNQREFDHLFRAGTEINDLLYSADPVERELAIEIITEVRHIRFVDAVSKLINDDDLSVKRAAIGAACKLNMKSLLPSIVDHLERKGERNIVLKGLHLYGDSLFEDINMLSGNSLNRHQPEFIKIATMVKGDFSTSYLLANLRC